MAFEVDPKWIKLFRTLQFIFLVTVFFLSAVYYSLNISFKLYKFIEFYFIFCLLISALLYAYLCLEFDLIKTPTNGNNLFSILTRKQIVIVVRIFISVIAVRFLFNSEYTLWADELLQHDFTNGFSVFDSAAGHQQPALPYMLSYWNIKLFGYNEFAIRGHNYAYGALLIVFLYSFLKTFKFSNLVTIFIVFAFSISPTVFQYGIESRPISFGLIFGIFTIFEILFRLNQRNFSWKSIGSVFLFALLLLISVGFQAPVFVGSLAFICLFISSEKTSLKLKLFFALIVALLCFLPIQYYIYQISSNYLKPVAPSGLHLDVLKNFANQFWYSVLRTDLTFLNPIELAGLIGILGLGLYFFDKKKTSFVKSTLELRRILIVGIYGISFTFLFLIFAHAAFVIAVQWNFNSRYLALFNIPFFYRLQP